MNATDMKARILGAVNDSLDVVGYDEGFIVFAPLQFSDDDAVSLYVRPEGGGWLVSDQATTLLRHQIAGVQLEAPRYLEAWRAVTDSYVPGGAAPGAIEAWGAEEQLPELILAVAQRAIRAEELRWFAKSRVRATFATNVTQRARRAFAAMSESRDGARFHERARVRSTSGRERQVTAAITYEGSVELAIQAVGGGSREARETAFEHAYTIFGNAELDHNARLAVAIGAPEAWDVGVLRELQSVTDVVFYDDDQSVEEGIRRHLPPALAHV